LWPAVVFHKQGTKNVIIFKQPRNMKNLKNYKEGQKEETKEMKEQWNEEYLQMKQDEIRKIMERKRRSNCKRQ
jgi:hypothetical protein